MKNAAILLIVLILTINIHLTNAQEPDWNRVLQLNTYGNQMGQVVTADANYVYMAGSITGPLTFEGTNFLSVGSRDMIIAKISDAGVTSWKTQINAQANGSISPNAIKVDPDENLFISGTFTGTITIGSSTITSTSVINAFMAEFDINGNGLWITAFESVGTGSSKIAIDASGNSYLLSFTEKLLKFNNSGVIQWEQIYPDKTLQAIAVHGTDLFIGGALQQGSTTFGSITLYGNYTANTGFLAKADLNGEYSTALVESTPPRSTKDGTYSATGTFVHPISGPREYNLNKSLIGSEENILTTSVGDLTGSTGNLILTINPDNSVSIGGTVISNPNAAVLATSGLENRYDPAEEKFYLNYEYTLTNGIRTISEVLTKSGSYSGGYGSAITDIAITNDGNLIITGSHTSNLTLNPISIVKTDISFYTFIAKCDNNFYFTWVNSSGSLINKNNEFYNYRVFIDNTGEIYEYGQNGNIFGYGSVLVNPNGNQFLVRFDSGGNAEEGFALQNTSSGRICVAPSLSIFSTGTDNVPFYGNLFLIKYDNTMIQSWKKVTTEAQSGTARISYVKHDTLGNTYVQSRVSGYCNYFGTIIKKINEVTVNAKLDLNGNLAWLNIVPDEIATKPYGSYFGPEFIVDKDQNLVTNGDFKTSLDIGTVSLANINSFNDGYILKYTPAGEIAWVVQLNTDGQYAVLGITTDEENNIIVSGEFMSQMTVLGHTISSDGIDAAFILKLDQDGNYLWAKSFPIGGIVYSAMPSTDKNNNIYLSADIENPKDQILTFGTVSIPQPEKEATVLAKFDAEGNNQWVKTYGAVKDDPASVSWPVDIKTDADGNSYLWGWCLSNASFGTTILVNPLSTTSYFYYLTKINTSGIVVWVKAVYEKTFSYNYGDLLDLDENGNVYIGGHFKDEINIETSSLTPEGTNDFFAAKYSNNGTLQWIKTIPSDMLFINSISVFRDNVLSIGGYSGKNSSLGSFEIFKKGGSSCIIATLGNLKFLTATPNTLTIEAQANSTAKFGIASNISWTATSDQPWLTLSNSIGMDYASITLTAEENPGAADRMATVTIMGTDVEPQTVYVTQSGLITDVKEITDPSVIDLYPNPNYGKFTLKLAGNISDDIKLTITNSAGVVFKDLKLMKQSGEINQEIDLGNIAKGVYFIQLRTDRTKLVKTFVVK